MTTTRYHEPLQPTCFLAQGGNLPGNRESGFQIGGLACCFPSLCACSHHQGIPGSDALIIQSGPDPLLPDCEQEVPDFYEACTPGFGIESAGGSERVVILSSKQDIQPMFPVTLPPHVVIRRGIFVVVAQSGFQLIIGPAVKSSLYAFAVRIKCRSDEAFRRAQFAQHKFHGFVYDLYVVV